MTDSPRLPSKKRIAARFNRAVSSYQSGAVAQAEIARRVAELAASEMGDGQIWCDLGSGGAPLAEHLRGVPAPAAGARIVCLDLAFAPLRRAVNSMRAALAVNADIDSLPFPPSALDGAAAASVLQWLASPVSALRGIARALKGGGPLCFGAFVDGAFAELVEIRARMGLPSAVWLPTASELLMVFDSAGFDVTAEGVECYESVQRFQDAAGAIGSMSRIGATAAGGRLLNRSELNRLYRDYALAFGKDGAVPITYRAVVGKARKRAD